MAVWLNVPLCFPKKFPLNSIYILRLLTAVKMKLPSELSKASGAFFEAYWVSGRNHFPALVSLGSR